MPLVFPEDIPHVSSFEEVMQSDGPVLWPCIEPQIFEKGRFQSIGQPSDDRTPDLRYGYDDAYQGAGWSVLRVKNAVVRGDLVQTSNGDVLVTIPWWRVGNAIGCYDRNKPDALQKGLAKFLSNRNVQYIGSVEEPCTHFYQGPHGHWLFEGLLPLAVWKQIGFEPALVVNEHIPNYRNDFLDKLNFPREKRFFTDRNTHDVLCKDLWSAVPWWNKKTSLVPLADGWTADHKHCYDLTTGWWTPSQTTLGLTQALGANAPSHLGAGDRIYVLREDLSRHRICLNEVDVLKVAEKYGFVGVSPSLLSAEAEAATFSLAKIICGSVGGGINNAVFSKPGTRVICLAAQEDLAWPLQGICNVNQLDLTVVYSTQFSSMDHFFHGQLSPFVVDLISFENLLKSL